MDRRVAQGRSPVGSPAFASSSTFVSVAVGLALVAIALVVYTVSHPYRFYDHFAWQAAAFLEGQAAIRYPVEATASYHGNAFFQDVLPVASTDGVPRALVPFPPLPAIVLMPFVWLAAALAGGHGTGFLGVDLYPAGLSIDGQLIFAVLAALDVGLAWWVLGRLPVRPWIRFAATVFFGFGTVFWYTAQLGTTWYQAHVLAVGLALGAVGVALGGDRTAVAAEDEPDDRVDDRPPARRPWFVPNRRQVLAGLLFGLACTSRLTVVFAAPFFVLVGAGGTWQRRGWSAALGAGIPIGALVVYNLVTTGHILHPGYQHLYELEATYYAPLNYHTDWAIEDIRYLPQNFAIMFLNTPVWLPNVVPSALGLGAPLCTTEGAVRGWFDFGCPLVLPRDTGMSILLTSPAYLLVVPALRWGYGHSRLVTGAALAVLFVAIVNLAHFSQGWVQFGYRFSNDFVPWALLLVAVGFERVARRATAPRSWPITSRLLLVGAVVLVVLSVVVNFWGVVWGDALGW
ncbi:MAG TPA: hypothetical protein VFP22_00460 [Candidatus Limnocylindrales bacterium]|nr:hypothetical protein [Candidatus Limnocylindrales bacterium]